MLGHTGCRPLQSWSWGGMRHHPFQPRVAYRQTVLSPARWLLPPDLIDAARDRARWPLALKAWQADTVPALPDVMVIEDGDRLLPLDLREDNDRELLRRHAGRGTRSVTEQPGGPDAIQAVLPGPDGDHVLELIVSLDRRASVSAPRRPASPRPAGAGLHLPGGEWLSLALRAPAHLHDQLATSLGEAVAALPQAPGRWFWLRYADAAMGPHLRARVTRSATRRRGCSAGRPTGPGSGPRPSAAPSSMPGAPGSLDARTPGATAPRASARPSPSPGRRLTMKRSPRLLMRPSPPSPIARPPPGTPTARPSATGTQACSSARPAAIPRSRPAPPPSSPRRLTPPARSPSRIPTAISPRTARVS